MNLFENPMKALDLFVEKCTFFMYTHNFVGIALIGSSPVTSF